VAFQDKSIQCSDCGTTFTFTSEEQEAFASRGYTNVPKRCPSCRQARKAQQTGNSSFGNSNYQSNGYSAPRQMFPAKCAQCGRETTVPFEPRNGRPVYCSDCYRKVRVSR
jgi:CxxC-x17-CxxC domain-containing protein